MAICPGSPSPAEPPFVGAASGWDRHLEPDTVHHVAIAHTAGAGWYRVGGDRKESVTPHYFQHFFTTRLWDRTDDHGIIRYFHGDIADNITDTYAYN